MELQFTLDVQASMERWTAETGRPASELLQDALAGYFVELASASQMLNGRYDDLKSGRVQPVPAAEVRARLKARSDALRAKRS